MEYLDVYAKQLMDAIIGFSPRVILALFVLGFGFWLADKTSNLMTQVLKKTNAQSPELQSFLGSIISIGLKVLVIISVAGIIGIETTSFVGVIAAMGFAVGLALQGNLSNFAAGIMILITRPFKVGDEIVTENIRGFVKEIQIFHTVLGQLDNTVMIIPNSFILNNPIQNSSVMPNRRVNTKFNIPYTEDFLKVKKIIIKAGYSVPEVDKDSKPFFYIKEFNDYSMRLSVSFVIHDKTYWKALVKIREAIILALQENDIKIIYPEGAVLGSFGNDELK
ncbi:MAG: mechanosensitive ion channel family protein [Aureispira sp.]|nr:mechanosensitive ion channel family protein [Aureispira sp.]